MRISATYNQAVRSLASKPAVQDGKPPVVKLPLTTADGVTIISSAEAVADGLTVQSFATAIRSAVKVGASARGEKDEDGQRLTQTIPDRTGDGWGEWFDEVTGNEDAGSAATRRAARVARGIASRAARERGGVDPAVSGNGHLTDKTDAPQA